MVFFGSSPEHVMGWVFMVLAAILFFLAGVGSPLVPNATTWGLFCMALGLAVGGNIPMTWTRRPPG
jgi:hypothetical protein